ncbi:MAG TPA: PaaI family thioesterase [Actinomycetota bacterium]|nr:PaaI family thioesterase [Actinomycetota bacterium]
MTEAPKGDVPKERFNPPFHRTLGVQMKIGDAGEGVAFIEVDPEKHYGNRWAHGGMVGVLADIASGIAIAVAMREDGRQAIDGTVELKVNFLRKVYEGDMTATAKVVHLGKRLAVTNVDVTNKGDLCAKAIATFMLSRSKT